MHRSEARLALNCIECGAEVVSGRDREYAVTDDLVLCHACAARRGGHYDESRDAWTEPPILQGLDLSDAAL